jgi:phospholipid/cholesterol/gamma-HCH transport system substrate-binding protein
MAAPRSTELKVGVFLLVCCGVLALMIVKFGSRNRAMQPNTYSLTVVFQNVAGLVKDTRVMYGGIGVGTVRDIQLDQEGMLKVNVKLAIYQGVKIRKDAKFVINQSGLLGDRYVDVIPQSGTAPVLQDGDVVTGMSSVDLSEAIRGVVDILKQTSGTIERVDQAIRRIDETVLSPASLGHVTNLMANLEHLNATLANVEAATSNAVILALSLRQLVDENRPRVDSALTSFTAAAANLNRTTQEAAAIVRANQDDIRQAVQDAASSAKRLNEILAALQQGQGTAGKLLVDPTLYEEATRLIQNLQKYGLLFKGTGSQSRDADDLQRSARGRVPVPARPAPKPAAAP